MAVLMTDDDKLQLDISRGANAQRLLDDEVLTGAFDGLKAEYLRRWEHCDPRDQDKREKLWWAVNAVNEVRAGLRSMVSDGTLARAELDALHK